ncbi:FAB1C [Symbiodinium sp. KB8]|nr:FAB1C [Symbiodinium sp. KB8]
MSSEASRRAGVAVCVRMLAARRASGEQAGPVARRARVRLYSHPLALSAVARAAVPLTTRGRGGDWMPDESASACTQCGAPFGWFRRRHHCRFCGRIFCNACSSHRFDGSKYGLGTRDRVCDGCFAIETSLETRAIGRGSKPGSQAAAAASRSAQLGPTAATRLALAAGQSSSGGADADKGRPHGPASRPSGTPDPASRGTGHPEDARSGSGVGSHATPGSQSAVGNQPALGSGAGSAEGSAPARRVGRALETAPSATGVAAKDAVWAVSGRVGSLRSASAAAAWGTLAHSHAWSGPGSAPSRFAAAARDCMLRWAQIHSAQAAWRIVGTSPALMAGGHGRHWAVLLTSLAWRAVATAAPDVRAGDPSDPRATVKIKTLRGGPRGDMGAAWQHAASMGLAEPLEAVLPRAESAGAGGPRGGGTGAPASQADAGRDLFHDSPDQGRARGPSPGQAKPGQGSSRKAPGALPVREDGEQLPQARPQPAEAAGAGAAPAAGTDETEQASAAAPSPWEKQAAAYAAVGAWPGCCALVRGVVFRKALPLKGMAPDVRAPRVLLLDDALTFGGGHRHDMDHAGQTAHDGGMHGYGADDDTPSRSAVLQQEDVYCGMLVRKIAALQPTLVLCSQGIARPVLEELAMQGVVAVPFVKRGVLVRVSRATGAAVVPSVNHLDKLPRAAVIGRARRFRVEPISLLPPGTSFPEAEVQVGGGLGRVAGLHPGESASAATRAVVERARAMRAATASLMRVDANPGQQGCTVILRGGPAALKSAKAALRAILPVVYTTVCEASCLVDMGLAHPAIARAILADHYGRRPQGQATFAGAQPQQQQQQQRTHSTASVSTAVPSALRESLRGSSSATQEYRPGSLPAAAAPILARASALAAGSLPPRPETDRAAPTRAVVPPSPAQSPALRPLDAVPGLAAVSAAGVPGPGIAVSGRVGARPSAPAASPEASLRAAVSKQREDVPSAALHAAVRGAWGTAPAAPAPAAGAQPAHPSGPRSDAPSLDLPRAQSNGTDPEAKPSSAGLAPAGGGPRDEFRLDSVGDAPGRSATPSPAPIAAGPAALPILSSAAAARLEAAIGLVLPFVLFSPRMEAAATASAAASGLPEDLARVAALRAAMPQRAEALMRVARTSLPELGPRLHNELGLGRRAAAAAAVSIASARRVLQQQAAAGNPVSGAVATAASAAISIALRAAEEARNPSLPQAAAFLTEASAAACAGSIVLAATAGPAAAPPMTVVPLPHFLMGDSASPDTAGWRRPLRLALRCVHAATLAPFAASRDKASEDLLFRLADSAPVVPRAVSAALSFSRPGAWLLADSRRRRRCEQQVESSAHRAGHSGRAGGDLQPASEAKAGASAASVPAPSQQRQGGAARLRSLAPPLTSQDVSEALEAVGAGLAGFERQAEAAAASAPPPWATSDIFSELSRPELGADVPGVGLDEPLEVLAMAETVTVSKSPYHRDNHGKSHPVLGCSPVWRICRAGAPGDTTLSEFLHSVAGSATIDVPVLDQDEDDDSGFPGPVALFGLADAGTAVVKRVNTLATTRTWWLGTGRIEARVVRLGRAVNVADHAPPTEPLPAVMRSPALPDRLRTGASASSGGSVAASPRLLPDGGGYAASAGKAASGASSGAGKASVVPPSPMLRPGAQPRSGSNSPRGRGGAAPGAGASAGQHSRAELMRRPTLRILPMSEVSDTEVLCFGTCPKQNLRSPACLLSRGAGQLSLTRFVEMFLCNRSVAAYQPAVTGHLLPAASQVRRMFVLGAHAVEFRYVPVPVLEVATRRILPRAESWAAKERDSRLAALLSEASRVHSGQMERHERCCFALGVDQASIASSSRAHASRTADAGEGAPSTPARPGVGPAGRGSPFGAQNLPGARFTTPDEIRVTAIELAVEVATASKAARDFAVARATAITAAAEAGAALPRLWSGCDEDASCDALAASTAAWRWATRAHAAEESLARLELVVDKVFGTGVPVVGAVVNLGPPASIKQALEQLVGGGDASEPRARRQTDAPPPTKRSNPTSASATLTAATGRYPPTASRSLRGPGAGVRSSRALPAAWMAQLEQSSKSRTGTSESGEQASSDSRPGNAGPEAGRRDSGEGGDPPGSAPAADGSASEADTPSAFGGKATSASESREPRAGRSDAASGSRSFDATDAPSETGNASESSHRRSRGLASLGGTTAGGGEPGFGSAAHSEADAAHTPSTSDPGARAAPAPAGSGVTPSTTPAAHAESASAPAAGAGGAAAAAVKAAADAAAAAAAKAPTPVPQSPQRDATRGKVPVVTRLFPGMELAVGGGTADFGLAPGVDGSVAPLDPSLSGSVVAHALLSASYWQSLTEGVSHIQLRQDPAPQGGSASSRAATAAAVAAAISASSARGRRPVESPKSPPPSPAEPSGPASAAASTASGAVPAAGATAAARTPAGSDGEAPSSPPASPTAKASWQDGAPQSVKAAQASAARRRAVSVGSRKPASQQNAAGENPTRASRGADSAGAAADAVSPGSSADEAGGSKAGGSSSRGRPSAWSPAREGGSSGSSARRSRSLDVAADRALVKGVRFSVEVPPPAASRVRLPGAAKAEAAATATALTEAAARQQGGGEGADAAGRTAGAALAAATEAGTLDQPEPVRVFSETLGHSAESGVAVKSGPAAMADERGAARHLSQAADGLIMARTSARRALHSSGARSRSSGAAGPSRSAPRELATAQPASPVVRGRKGGAFGGALGRIALLRSGQWRGSEELAEEEATPADLVSKSRLAAKRASEGAEAAAVQSHKESATARGSTAAKLSASASQGSGTSDKKGRSGGQPSRYELRRVSTRQTLSSLRGRLRAATSSTGGAKLSPTASGADDGAAKYPGGGHTSRSTGDGLARELSVLSSSALTDGSMQPSGSLLEEAPTAKGSGDVGAERPLGPERSGEQRGALAAASAASHTQTSDTPPPAGGCLPPLPEAAREGSEDAGAVFEPTHPLWSRGCFGRTLALTPEEILLSSVGQDVVVASEGQGRDGSVKLRVSCLWATHFHALRQLCLGSQRSFVESLAISSAWRTSGGKSGSTFERSQDHRFVVKAVSRNEFTGFTRNALAYFDHMREALCGSIVDPDMRHLDGSAAAPRLVRSRRPSFLVRILGAFEVNVSFTPPTPQGAAARFSRARGPTTKSFTRNVLVMENLWYGTTVPRGLKFDLKGKARNIQASDEAREAINRARHAESERAHAAAQAEHGPQAAGLAADRSPGVGPTAGPDAAGTGAGASPDKAEKSTVLLDSDFLMLTEGQPLALTGEPSLRIEKAVDAQSLHADRSVCSCLPLPLPCASPAMSHSRPRAAPSPTLAETSMAVLMDGLRGDTEFLCDCRAMDYSLLVGVNSSAGRIVVGIIDYANTFTTTKFIEHAFKSIIESDATVQAPARYRSRMLRAVRAYFMPVPTRLAGPAIALGLRSPTPVDSLGSLWEAEHAAIDSDADAHGWRLASAPARSLAEPVLGVSQS